MANLNLLPGVANKRERKIKHSCSHSDNFLSLTASCMNNSLRFSYLHKPSGMNEETCSLRLTLAIKEILQHYSELEGSSVITITTTSLYGT